MNSAFWSHTIWYILLLITSIVSFVIAFYKTQNRKLAVGFFFSVVGFLFALESILTIVLRAYTYHPKLFSDRVLEAVSGNYFSQLSIASTALLICTFDLSYIWYIVFAVVYFLTDWLFMGLGVYEHHWYKSVYTLISFIPLFWFLKKWYHKIRDLMSGYIIYYTTLFLAVFAINSLSIILIFRLLGVQIFRGHIFAESSLDHTTTGLIYQFVQINLLMILSELRWHWLKKGMGFAGFFLLQYLLFRAGLVYIAPGWFFPVTLIDSLGCYGWIALFRHLLFSGTIKRKCKREGTAG